MADASLQQEWVQRPLLQDLDYLSTGKRARLERMLYQFGAKNGTLMVLPIDQGLEHGPIDFFDNPDSLDPDYQYRLAMAGGYNGIALHYGLAEKYQPHYAGKIPLILKLNGKTNIPSDDVPLSPLTGTVADAVRFGADAVGYTLYVGSSAQYEDFSQFLRVRDEAGRFGMPVIVWAYPRGEFAKKRGGIDSPYNIEYAARVACELGADIVKVNLPKVDAKSHEGAPAPYDTLDLTVAEAARRVVKAAGRTLVLFSGGSRVPDADLIAKARLAMEAGATGLIFGRNVWQRQWDNAMAISQEFQRLMAQF
ncbi:MAG: fructose-bisphosphate aldolase [Candidatus Sericytochromatia bacterium]|nr:fructose-bisphosphate aldolase [Candidatus Sericytochromatia bacterium]